VIQLLIVLVFVTEFNDVLSRQKAGQEKVLQVFSFTDLEKLRTHDRVFLTFYRQGKEYLWS
jgi:hypothetical protein